MNRLWLFSIALLLAAPAARAQRDGFPPDIFDTRPAALDPAHFQHVFENDRVTVLRVRLGPREKSMVMEIPAHVMTCVTDQHVRVIYAHDKPIERAEKAGYTGWVKRAEYALENLTDKPVEWVLVVPNDAREPV
ncbi:MAG TPA: hypothetical protein VJN43_19675 [Bryobacteraceae bacterium]|nr:hypothetical protein [Bryobacteraceae bacterium]